MRVTHHVEALQRQLLSAAGAGGPETQATAERLVAALDPAVRLAILEALSEAAGEITRELAPGAVDVRLRGRDVDFVVSRPADDEPARETPVVGAPAGGTPPATDDADDATTSRVSLRLPESLKSRAEAAATAEGVSLNTWLVRAVGTALEPRPAVRRTRGSTFTGWIR